MPDYLLKQRQGWYAVLEIPKDLRGHFGKARFKETLKTQSRSVAEIRVLSVVQGWKHAIQIAREDTSSDDPNSWRRELDRLSATSPEWEAREALFNWAIDIGNDAFVAYQVATGEEILLSEHVDDFLNTLDHTKVRDMRERHLRLFVSGFRLASDVSAEKVEDWVHSKLLEERGISIATAKSHVSTYRIFWRYLSKKKLVDRSLDHFADVLPNQKQKTPSREHFTSEDYRKLLSACTDDTLSDLIRLGAYTGCRIEELCNLETANVTSECLDIKDSKTKAGIRKVPIHTEIRQVVARLKDTSTDGYLLSGLAKDRYNDRSAAIGKRFSKLKTMLGYGRTHVFHSFRRGVVTQFEEAGVPESVAARIVGHEYKNITFGTYSGGASLDTLREAVEMLRW